MKIILKVKNFAKTYYQLSEKPGHFCQIYFLIFLIKNIFKFKFLFDLL